MTSIYYTIFFNVYMYVGRRGLVVGGLCRRGCCWVVALQRVWESCRERGVGGLNWDRIKNFYNDTGVMVLNHQSRSCATAGAILRFKKRYLWL